VALVLRAGGVGLDLLLIQRTEHPADPWSGHVAFPGGRADPDDVNLVATAIRETREEVGIDLGGAEHIGALDELQAVGRMRAMELSIAPHVFAITPGEAPLSLSDEVASAHWLPLSVLADPAVQSAYLHEHEGLRYTFPCIRAGGLVIWGLTHQMLTGFLALLPDPGLPR
jgi:8-oxo-dGTP pyrophosphatase MutT (NUDIX family)